MEVQRIKIVHDELRIEKGNASWAIPVVADRVPVFISKIEGTEISFTHVTHNLTRTVTISYTKEPTQSVKKMKEAMKLGVFFWMDKNVFDF